MRAARSICRLYTLLPLIVFLGGVALLSPEIGDDMRRMCRQGQQQFDTVGAKLVRPWR